MWDSSFTYTLSWLKLGQAPEEAVLPSPQVSVVCSQLHSFTVLTSICVAMWGSGSGNLSEWKQYSSPKRATLEWEKVARGIGRVELLLLAVMSAYAGSKHMWNYTYYHLDN